MAESTLCVDRKARRVSRVDLALVPTPEPEGRWKPLPHVGALDMALSHVGDAGFQVQNESIALSNDNMQVFATYDLATEIVDGVGLTMGVRSSLDKSLSFGVYLGERVFLCTNLCWTADVFMSRKHTTRIVEDVNQRLPEVMSGIPQYATVAAERVQRLQHQVLDPEQASHIMLRAAERGVIGWSMLKKLTEEWQNPAHEEFRVRSKWAMLNALTEVSKTRQAERPNDAARMTMAFQSMLLSA